MPYISNHRWYGIRCVWFHHLASAGSKAYVDHSEQMNARVTNNDMSSSTFHFIYHLFLASCLSIKTRPSSAYAKPFEEILMESTTSDVTTTAVVKLENRISPSNKTTWILLSIDKITLNAAYFFRAITLHYDSICVCLTMNSHRKLMLSFSMNKTHV
jgi:hypothetical protein